MSRSVRVVILEDHLITVDLLSNSYVRLDVSNRAAAITKVREIGLIAPYINEPHSIK